MASSYVNDLRLNEMATGDASGTWGTVTNTNLELIGEALGFGTEAITTNADTHTSTVADGATDPARAMYIKYTGTLDSACTITIAPNTLNRLHFIENGTSGSQNIIISQGSGANVTIPAGDTKAVYLDGAGSGAAVVDAFASLNVVDLKVQDDLTVTDDATIGGTLGVTGVVTANAGVVVDNITIDGTEIDLSSGDLTLDVAGNILLNADGGGVYFQDASTLVGSIQNSSSDLVITSEVQDKDIIFKGDDGGSSVTALTLDMSDGGTALFNHDIKLTDNSIALFGTGNDLQIYHDGNDSNIADVGTGTLLLKTDGAGIYLQKGSSETLAQFKTDAEVNLYHNNVAKFATTSTGVAITGGFTATDGCTITTADNTPQLKLISTDADANAGPILELKRDSSSPAADDFLGNVDFIGENNASEEVVYGKIIGRIEDVTDGAEDGRLTLKTMRAGSSRSAIDCRIDAIIVNDDGDDVDFRVESNDSANMFVVNAGTNKIGIGTNSPAHAFEVIASSDGSGISGDDTFIARFVNSEATDGRSYGVKIQAGSTNADSPLTLKDHDDNNTLFHFKGGGQADFRTTNADYMLKLDVHNTSGDGLWVRQTAGTPNSASRFYLLGQDETNGKAAIYTNGDFYSRSGTYGTFSDESIKQDIKDANSQWEDIKAVKVRNFRLKDEVAEDADYPYHIGVIAQEIEASGMNGLVSENLYKLIENEDGTKTETTKKGVKYSILYVKALKALQEAMTRIETLEASNTALEARITALENA